MGAVDSGLADRIGSYRSDTYICPTNPEVSFQCGCMLLGALTKQMDSLGLIERPLFGQDLHSVHDKLYAIKSPRWAHDTCNHNSYYHNSSLELHNCDLSTAVRSMVKVALGKVAGLGLIKESEQIE